MEIDIPAERLVNGNTVFFTFATSGYTEFVRNLHASLLRSDPYLASRLVVFCADEQTAEALRAAEIFAIDCDTSGLPEFAEFLGSGFGRVVSYKYQLARTLLTQAEYVWWCDGDIVVQAPVAERVRALMQEQDCDLLMQHEWPKDVLNLGFWIARRGPGVDAMLAEMIEYTTSSDWDDQSYFNDREFAKIGLRVAALDHDEFMCGNRFYFSYLRRTPECRLMHFNYSVGRATKKALMMGHGCWYLDEPRAAWRRARVRHLVLFLAARMGVESPEERLQRSMRRAKRAWGRLRAR